MHISFKFSPKFRPIPAVGIISIGQFGAGIFNISQFGIGVFSLSQFTLAGYAVTKFGFYINEGYGQVVKSLF